MKSSNFLLFNWDGVAKEFVKDQKEEIHRIVEQINKESASNALEKNNKVEQVKLKTKFIAAIVKNYLRGRGIVIEAGDDLSITDENLIKDILNEIREQLTELINELTKEKEAAQKEKDKIRNKIKKGIEADQKRDINKEKKRKTRKNGTASKKKAYKEPSQSNIKTLDPRGHLRKYKPSKLEKTLRTATEELKRRGRIKTYSKAAERMRKIRKMQPNKQKNPLFSNFGDGRAA